jgi:glycosyltransferase involved in cell wall biosynthesis
MARLAWFSPLPPVRTGVAAYSAEVVAALRADHEIDVFTDHPTAGARSAHDFIWEHQQRPYDLPVYQLGNSSFHDYIWPYLFRYPGLTVLHDAHLHHARAAQLLRVKRSADYREEFKANERDTGPEMAELAVKGFDTYLYYSWPMRKLAVDASKVTAVHATLMADALRDESPNATVETIRLGHGEPVSEEQARVARARVRERYGLDQDDVVFGVFGALTPEKRLPQILDAFAEVRRYAPRARMMLAGAIASHYDLAADIGRRNLGALVAQTGYLPDGELTAHLVACDVSMNLRWPTAREMSGPWLRALAAGLATVVVDLAHTADVPSLDPRTWTVSHARPAGQPAPEPITVAIDILDEAHSLRLAMRRLALDADLRTRLGAAAADFWHREHSMQRMLEDYRRVIRRALERPAPQIPTPWPAHLVDRGQRQLDELLKPFEVPQPLRVTL